ncbi:hypothetical protein BH10PSE7_BH10PSE7_30610 [soil metagenome]
MLTYLYSSIFDSPAQTLVNTVNTIGVMGKGIAKAFRERYPAMFREYKSLCDRGGLSTGNLHLWKGAEQWVLNFPTKTTWRLPSKIEYIESGLVTFVDNYERMGIVSASFPPLGCGNGNLSWDDVRPLMEHYLSKINIPVYVHSLHVAADFVPEHKEVHVVPVDFTEFWRDLQASMYENKGVFYTGEGNHPYSVHVHHDDITITRSGKNREKIPYEELQNAWVILRDGILSGDKFSDEASKRFKSYLFPLLKSLPYVRAAPMSRSGQKPSGRSEGLFLARHSGESRKATPSDSRQGCLSV